jgi:hypothetical protein
MRALLARCGAFVARNRADLMQVAGAAVLVAGIGFAFGWAVGTIAAGLGIAAYGISEERG